MKQRTKQNIRTVLFFVSFFVSIAANAQNELEDAGNDPDIPNVPLDGGLSLLIGAGAVYAGKRLHHWKNEKSEDEK